MREPPLAELELLSLSYLYFFLDVLNSLFFLILKYIIVYSFIYSLYIYIIIVVAATIQRGSKMDTRFNVQYICLKSLLAIQI
jgi:hypothetical protein